jgi:hypothetical protein
MKNIKLGCDPEAFLIDIRGQLHSSVGLIGGSKEFPRPLGELGEGFAVQEDNVAIEFNIPPSGSKNEFITNVQRTLEYLTQQVNQEYGFVISRASAASFPAEELQTEAAQVFGCDPDFNAWTCRPNPKPKAADPNLRSCGGHVHIGYDKAMAPPHVVAQWCDLYLGVGSVILDDGLLRKQLYGKHGAFRPKPYGLEYRTLSNFWIFSPETIGWVWDNTNKALDAVDARRTLSTEDGEMIAHAIDNNDVDVANILIKKFNVELLNV